MPTPLLPSLAPLWVSWQLLHALSNVSPGGAASLLPNTLVSSAPHSAGLWPCRIWLRKGSRGAGPGPSIAFTLQAASGIWLAAAL